MTLIYLRSKDRDQKLSERTGLADWPRVTIQLPTFNERYIIERLLKAVSRLDYPCDHLQVQVLDDSTDDTVGLVRSMVQQFQKRGLSIELVQRAQRSGFKAGALNTGLQTATGELIAIFDADFIPPPDWLKRTVLEFGDPRLGCLQTRWGHANGDYSSFTRALALGIDGHFVVEQTARSRNGLFLNFNGTAGLWRRACIEDAGGWETDTLTEDLDLSYRAQLRGWRIGYLPDVVVPGELPAQVEAFKRQQFRWAKGSIQTARKLVPELLKADLPLHVRLMGLVHITGYLVSPLMLLTFALVLPIGLLAPHSLKMFPWGLAASFGPPLMYLAARSEHAPRPFDRLKVLPLMIVIGFGLSLNNTLAVMQGLFSRKTGTFVRTPKFNLVGHDSHWAGAAYTVPVSPIVWGEVALACYSLLTIALLQPKFGLGIVPWMLVYTAGYTYMAGLNLVQNWQSNHPEAVAGKRLHARQISN